MADNDKTRTEIVEDNIDAAVAQYGSENYMQIFSVILQDISVSLAMLVDAGSGS